MPIRLEVRERPLSQDKPSPLPFAILSTRFTRLETDPTLQYSVRLTGHHAVSNHRCLTDGELEKTCKAQNWTMLRLQKERCDMELWVRGLFLFP